MNRNDLIQFIEEDERFVTETQRRPDCYYFTIDRTRFSFTNDYGLWNYFLGHWSKVGKFKNYYAIRKVIESIADNVEINKD